MSQELVLSQEAGLPAVPTGRNTRGRAQTRKTKMVEHTTQEEETPAGDTVEIHQVREVQEVVKKVAVVRRGRQGAAQRQQEEEEEEGEAGEDGAEEEEEEAGPSRRVTRRMDSELKHAIEQDLEPMAGKPGGARRTWKRVVVEGGTAPGPEEQGGSGKKGGKAVAGKAVAERAPSGSQVAPPRRSSRSQPRFHAEKVVTDIPPEEALEPRVPSAVLEEAMNEIAEEGQQEAEAEAEELAQGEAEGEADEGQAGPEFSTPPDNLAELEATPEDLLVPFGGVARPGGQEAPGEEEEEEDMAEEEQEEEEEEQPQEAAPPVTVTPAARRKRKAPGVDAAEAAGPSAAQAEASAGQAGPRRSSRRGLQFTAEPAGPSAAEEQEEEEAAALAGEEMLEGDEVAQEGVVEEMGQEEEEEEEEEADQAAQPASARGAVLGAAEAVGSMLRSVLTGGRTQADKRPRTPKKMPAAQPRAAKGGVAKKSGKKKRGTGKAAFDESYKRYVHRVLQQTHPDLKISSLAMGIMDSFMKDAFERITAEAANLTRHSKRKTLTAREVQTAVKLVVPGELGRHAVVEGKKAVARFSGL